MKLRNPRFHTRLPAAIVWVALLAVGFAPTAHPEGHTPATRAGESTPDRVVIRAGHLIDPATGSVKRNQSILIEDQRVVETSRAIELSEGTREIDLSGWFVLPGLFDAHTHLCSRMSARWHVESFLVHSLAIPTGRRAIIGAVHAREMLDADFTTVRDLGNAGLYADMDVRRAIRDGLIVGPTVVPAGRIIAPFGGQFRWQVRKEVLEDPEYLFADSRDELRKAIRENVYYGADVIKIVVDGQPYAYSTDEIRFIVAQAQEAGVRVAAHCQTQEGARRAAAAGVASIEHGWVLEEAEFELMQRNNVALVPTDASAQMLKLYGWSDEDAERIHQKRVDRLRRAFGAGVRIVFGSDVVTSAKGRSRGELSMGYIDTYVEAGMPTLKILKTMTVHAAELLGVEETRGRIRAGFAADVIATRKNPLEDIQALKRVGFVMKDGHVIKHVEPYSADRTEQ